MEEEEKPSIYINQDGVDSVKGLSKQELSDEVIAQRLLDEIKDSGNPLKYAEPNIRKDCKLRKWKDYSKFVENCRKAGALRRGRKASEETKKKMAHAQSTRKRGKYIRRAKYLQSNQPIGSVMLEDPIHGFRVITKDEIEYKRQQIIQKTIDEWKKQLKAELLFEFLQKESELANKSKLLDQIILDAEKEIADKRLALDNLILEQKVAKNKALADQIELMNRQKVAGLRFKQTYAEAIPTDKIALNLSARLDPMTGLPL